jgi:hypothetical protein
MLDTPRRVTELVTITTPLLTQQKWIKWSMDGVFFRGFDKENPPVCPSHNDLIFDY